jgi:hypothetical protein
MRRFPLSLQVAVRSGEHSYVDGNRLAGHIPIALNQGSESSRRRFWADFITNMAYNKQPRRSRPNFCGAQECGTNR